MTQHVAFSWGFFFLGDSFDDSACGFFLGLLFSWGFVYKVGLVVDASVFVLHRSPRGHRASEGPSVGRLSDCPRGDSLLSYES